MDIAKKTRAAAVGLMMTTAVAWTTPAAAFLDSEQAWNDVLQFAVRQINAPGEFEIELGRVTRPEEGFAKIDKLAIKDGDGVWVTAKNIVIDWRLRSLMRAKFAFQTMSAEEIDILRAPISRGDPPGDGVQMEFSWPRPPTALSIDNLKIDRLIISDKLAPQRVVAKVEGAFSDVGDAQESRLKIERIEGPKGVFDFRGALDFDAGTADITLTAAEGRGGLVAKATGLPPDQDVSLTLASKGSFSDLPFTLDGRIGDMGAAKGAGKLGWRGGALVKFDGAITPDDKAAKRWRDALGKEARLTLDFAQEGSAYKLNAFSVKSAVLEAEGKGDIAPAQDKANLDLEWRITDAAALGALTAPTKIGAAQGFARVTGRLSAPTADISATIEDAKGDFGSADMVALEIKAAPPAGAPTSGPTDSLFTMKLGTAGLKLKDANLAEGLGDAPYLEAKGAYRATKALAELQSLSLKTDGLEAEGQGAYDLRTSLFDGQLSGTAAQIAPFARMAGLDLKGAATFSLTADKLGSKGAKALTLDAALSGIDSKDKNLKAALGDQAAFALEVEEAEPGVMEIKRGSLVAASFEADAKGRLSIPKDSVDLALDWRATDARALSALIPGGGFGAAQGRATVTQTLSEPLVSTTARVEKPDYAGAKAKAMTLEAQVQPRKDRRTPFSFETAIEAPDLGDAPINRLVGQAPKLKGEGLYDSALKKLEIAGLTADLAAGRAQIKGSIDNAEQRLALDVSADLPDMAPLSDVVGEKISGAGKLTAKIGGSFAAPDIDATLAAKKPAFGPYKAEAATLKAKAAMTPAGLLKFDADLAAEKPELPDARLAALIGPAPRITATGSYHRRAGGELTLDQVKAALAAGTAEASGSANLQNRTIDLKIASQVSDFGKFSDLAGERLAGSGKLDARVSGSFDAPEIAADIAAAKASYGAYQAESVKLKAKTTLLASGAAPFEADLALESPRLNDPRLEAALGRAPSIALRGDYTAQTGALKLSDARARLAAGDVNLKGGVNIRSQELDLAFEAAAPNLDRLSALAGEALGGALKASGALRGAFAAPAVTLQATGREIAYGPYRLSNLNLDFKSTPRPDGALPFSATATLKGAGLDDPRLKALLGGEPKVVAQGAFNRETGRLELERASIVSAAGTVDLKGLVETKIRKGNLEFAADLKDLSMFSALAGADLGGAFKGSGRISGDLAAPEASFAGELSGPRFGAYGAKGVTLKAATRPGPKGALEFDADLTARVPRLGDAKLEALLGDPRVTAKGSFDPASGRLTLSPAQVVAAAGAATLNGSYGTKDQSLDLAFNLDAQDIGRLQAGLGGSLKASGRLEGTVKAPRVAFNADGRDLVYDQYGLANLKIEASAAPGPGGVIPFTATADLSGARLGDPKLEALIGAARLSAKGSFDPTSGRLTLQPAQVVAAAGAATLNGSYGIKDQSLDLAFNLDAQDIGRLQAGLGGSLKANGRLEGTVKAPRVALSADGRDLVYDKYGLANLKIEASAAPGPGGVIPFTATADLSGARLGDPRLEALLSGARLSAKGSFDPASGRLTLQPAQATTTAGAATLNGTYGTKDQSLDLAFNLDAQDIGRLQASLGGSLKANGRLEGTVKAPRVALNAEGRSLVYETYALAHLKLEASATPGPDGAIPFTATADLSGASLGDPKLDALLGAGRVAARGAYDPAARRLRLDDATAQAAAGAATARGEIDLAAQTLALDATLDAPDLSPFSGLAGKPLAGALKASARLTGPLADPSAQGTADLAGLSYDGRVIGAAQARFDLRHVATSPQGDASLSAQTPQGPFTATARFMGGPGGGFVLESLTAQGLGLKADGRLSIGKTGLMDGALRLTAADLGPLGRLLGYEAQGSLTAEANFSSASGRQSVSATGAVAGARVSQNGAMLLDAQNIRFTASADDALGNDPLIRANIDSDRAALGGLRIDAARIVAAGPLSALDVEATGSGDFIDDGVEEADNFAVNARVSARKSGGLEGLALTRFTGRVGGMALNLSKPLSLARRDGGYGFEDLDLRIEDGQASGSFTYSPMGAYGRLSARGMPMTLARLAGAPQISGGRLDADVDIARGNGSGRFTAEARDVTVEGAALSAPVLIKAEGEWAGRALDARLNLSSPAFAQPLTATARLSLLPPGGSPFPTPDPNGPITAQADWAGDLSEIWPLVPAPDHVLSGPARLSARVEGSIKSPRASGGLNIQNGRYENLAYGTVIQNLTADAAFGMDGRVSLTAQGADGYGGSVTARGSYALQGGALDAAVTLNRMAVARRDDITAVASGEVTAKGDAAAIRVAGRINNDFLEFRLIGGGAPNLVVVDATPVGKTAPRLPRAPKSSKTAQKINLDLVISVPGQAYVRGRGLESEWDGELRVTGHAGAPRIVGVIEKRRGWLDLLGRQFDLETGEARFSGDLDPLINIRLTRASTEMRGWIDVTGHSSAPKIEFGSDQGLPRDEILPRLLFGRSQQSLSAIEAAQLAAGVATLMSGKPGALDTLRGAVGVDTLRLEEDANGGAVVSTGKYIADGVFVGAKQNLATGKTSALIEIETIKNITIEGEISPDETTGSVNWKHDY